MLVEMAAKQGQLSGLAEVLRHIGEAFDATACIVWQVAPYYNTDLQCADTHLHVAVHWLKDVSHYVTHDLPFKSVTGKAIKKDVTLQVSADNDEVHKDTFLKEHNLKWFCSVPLKFEAYHDQRPDLGSALGALNIYRNREVPFSEAELAYAGRVGRVLPTLYQSIRERATFVVIGEVRDLIQDAERENQSAPDVMQRLCEILHDHFSCIESSIFLENPLNKPKEYEFQGGTCRKYLRQEIYTESDDGLTAWVIRNKRPVRIIDLAHFKRDLPLIQQQYDGLKWNDSLQIEQTTRLILRLEPTARLPPFSFIAVPVIVGATILGVIRCCTAWRAPYYFHSADVAFLSIVASQIGHFWKSFLTRQEMKREIQQWRSFGAGIGELNGIVLAELERSVPDRRAIYKAGMEIAVKVIPNAEILDVRLYDPANNDLYFYEVYGAAWAEGDPDEIKRRRQNRFPVGEGPEESAGAWVFRNNHSSLGNDVNLDPHYKITFLNTRHMIIAPISSKSVKYGVLDIRSTSQTAIPPHAEMMAALLGQQLGLYEYLAETLRVQAASYEDLEHQLRSPIRQALERLNPLVSNSGQDSHRELVAVRGLLGKAHRVVRSLTIFRIIHSGHPLRLSLSPLTEDAIIKSLIETGSDNELLLGSQHGIRFHVDRTSFAPLRLMRVMVDFDLVEQALHNIVENAFKYAHPETTIRIAGSVQAHFFCISVINQGVEISEGEKDKCVERGWRGELAKSVTPSGSGIGLWLVDHIMRAHRGRIQIIPTTTADRVTVVRLWFPVRLGARRLGRPR
jgi:signal transduction histidine kinase